MIQQNDMLDKKIFSHGLGLEMIRVDFHADKRLVVSQCYQESPASLSHYLHALHVTPLPDPSAKLVTVELLQGSSQSSIFI